MNNPKSNITAMLQYNKNDVSVHSISDKYQGYFAVKEYTLQHRLFCGKQSGKFSREVFERGDAVVVMAYDAALDKVLLIEQFRVGAIRGEDSPWLLEFIAGMFDGDESPLEVAIREAKEETNLTLTQHDLVPIMQYLSSPGGMSERIHLYLAHFNSVNINTDDTYGLEDENEDIMLHLVSRDKAMELLAQGKITNAATIIGLQWLALNYLSLMSEKKAKESD